MLDTKNEQKWPLTTKKVSWVRQEAVVKGRFIFIRVWTINYLFRVPQRGVLFLQFFGKADNPVRLFESYRQMKFQALGIVQLAIAGKLPTAFFFFMP